MVAQAQTDLVLRTLRYSYGFINTLLVLIMIKPFHKPMEKLKNRLKFNFTASQRWSTANSHIKIPHFQNSWSVNQLTFPCFQVIRAISLRRFYTNFLRDGDERMLIFKTKRKRGTKIDQFSVWFLLPQVITSIKLLGSLSRRKLV